MLYKINGFLSGLFGYNNQVVVEETTTTTVQEKEEKIVTMKENNDTATSSTFNFTVEDSFGDEVNIKNHVIPKHHHHGKRRNSKRFVIGDESGDDVESTVTTTMTLAETDETLLMVPNPEWLQQSAKLKPGTTLT